MSSLFRCSLMIQLFLVLSSMTPQAIRAETKIQSNNPYCQSIHVYEEQTAERTIIYRHHTIKTPAVWSSTSQQDGLYQMLFMDAKGNTLEWWSVRPDILVRVRRLNLQSIEILERRTGDVRISHITTPDGPWFQQLALSLQPFLKSGGEHISYWMLRPDSLEPLELQARREEQKGKAPGPLITIEVRFTGLLSRFWRSVYQFGVRDFRFMSYEGSNGLPGTPMTHVRHLASSGDCR